MDFGLALQASSRNGNSFRRQPIYPRHGRIEALRMDETTRINAELTLLALPVSRRKWSVTAPTFPIALFARATSESHRQHH